VGAAFAAHGFISLARRWQHGEHHPAAREKAEEQKRREQGPGDDVKGGQQ
jgi:hypothetical protein